MLLKNLMKTQRGPNWVDDSVRPNQLPYQDPTALLGPAKATEHAQSFRDGAHAFVPDWAFNHIGGFFGGWGRQADKETGAGGGNFVSPKGEAQSTITTADDEGKTGVAKLERSVGLEEGSWSNNGAINHIYRFHVDPSFYDHRLGKVPTPPLGHESGVDPKLWRAGGKALKPNAKPGDGPGQTEGVIPDMRTHELLDHVKDGRINISKLTFEPGSDQHTDEALSHETIEHLFRQQHFKDNTKKIERIQALFRGNRVRKRRSGDD